MIALHYSTTDPFRLHGIRHFWDTEGLPEPDADSKVGIAYGDVESKTEYTIRVIENDISDRTSGWIEYDGETAPLFETPAEVKGELIATFKSDTSYSCASESGKEITIGFDVFNQAGRILSGHLEGRYPTEASEIPALDIYERILFDSIKKLCNKAGSPLVCKAKWPNEAPYAVCLTHDVDEVRKTYQHITSPLKYAALGIFGKAFHYVKNSISDISSGRDPYWTFEELIKLEDELAVKSSLFFLEEKGKFTIKDPKSIFLMARRYELTEPKIAAMIKRLDAGGWDVGVHGSYYSYDNPQLFKAEKEKLDSVLGHPTSGTRQHHLNLKIPETWRSHEAAGIKYDCTLGYKNKPGFRWGTCQPFTPLDPNTKTQINITEIPTTIMDTPLFYQKNNPTEIINRMQETVKKHSGVLTLLWHHTVFNTKEFPGWAERYKQIIMQAKKDGAWITTGHQIAAWGVNRYKQKDETLKS